MYDTEGEVWLQGGTLKYNCPTMLDVHVLKRI